MTRRAVDQLLRLALLPLVAISACVSSMPPAPPTLDPQSLAVLDGMAPIQPEPLANLALDRAAMGAEWLGGVLRDDGSFYYEYDPDDDEYVEDEYNEVRHAGTTYSLFYAAGATGDPEILQAATKAVEYIDRNSVPMDPGRGFAYSGQVKLGGQALAIVALLEGRRVTGDDRFDALIHELAAFLVSLEMPDQPGRYFQYVQGTERLAEPVSSFFPGEALLALTRLAHHFPDDGYLEAAQRAAHYLLKVRDGDVTVLSEPTDIDHWLTIALSDLHRLAPEPDYVTGVRLHANAIANRLWWPEDGIPARVGGIRSSSISYTGTATRGEAMVAAWALAKRHPEETDLDRWSEAAQRIAQFQMRVQFADASVGLFPEPSRATGGWPANVADSDIRIDYVQHHISALLGVWYLWTRSDLPQA